MNRYRVSRSTTRRAPVRRAAPRRSSGLFTGPIVAFLLIASFGILFAGCSRVKGPNDLGQNTMEDTTFTADDIAQFHSLSGGDGASAPADGAVSSVNGGLQVTGTGGVQDEGPALDPALAARYQAVRASVTDGKDTYRVINEFVNVRAAANQQSANVGRLTRGEQVKLLEFVNASWAKVQLPSGAQGFVSAAYIGRTVSSDALAEEKKAFENLYFVDYRFVNVRQAPDSGSAKVGQIDGQAFVKPLSVDKDWAKVTVDGKEGYVSLQFLKLFSPIFVVRQTSFTLPVLQYRVDQPGVLDALLKHAAALRADGERLTTMREFFDIILLQEQRDTPVPAKSVVLAVTGVTQENVKQVSSALYGAGIRATLFLHTQDVGVSGITQKTIQTLQANGFDIQSAGHTGDDLRTLPTSQMKLELNQSRTLLEDATRKTIFAVLYPDGGTNDRIQQTALQSGYLFGIGNAPSKTFTRDDFLRMPSLSISASMTPEEVVQAVH